MAKDQTLYCSFCGKSQHEVKKLIAGPTVFICDECVDLCADIIESDANIVRSNANAAGAGAKKRLAPPIGVIPAVQEISDVLDDNIPEQDTATKLLTVFLHRHYARMYSASNQAASATTTNNIILIGESTDRNEVIQSLTRCIDRPVAIVNAMTLAKLNRAHDIAHIACPWLLAASAFRFKTAQAGIIFIDDFDQLCGPANRIDAIGERFQQELSDLMPGTAVTRDKNSRSELEQSDAPNLYTDEISFIFGGGFYGLPALEGDESLNKGQTRDEIAETSGGMLGLPGLSEQGIRALEDFGMLPELLQSVSAIAELKPPTLPDTAD